MNNLEAAAERIERSWCKHVTFEKDTDKFCAVGALAREIMGEETFAKMPFVQFDAKAYEIVENSPEGAALAEAICEEQHRDFSMYSSSDFSNIIWGFNDWQDSYEPVAQMMRLAAKRFEETNESNS